MNPAPKRILIVEDDAGLALLFGEHLRRTGFLCDTVASAQVCIAWLEKNTADLMVLDYSLPDLLAPALVAELRKIGRLPAFVVVTGQGDERVAVELMKLGARDYLVKDHLVFDRLPAVVQRGLQDVEKERRLAAMESALRAEKERLRRAELVGGFGHWEFDVGKGVIRGSAGAKRIYGLEGEEWPIAVPQGCVLPAYRPALDVQFQQLITGVAPYDSEFEIRRQTDGQIIAVHSMATFDPVTQTVFGIIQDISERRRVEAALRESLHEKEALLKEVHHRVKNNLQVITSLLRLQAGQSENAGTREVLRDMQNRIRSMALLHETLYRSGNLARVDLAHYLETVCTQLLCSTAHPQAGLIRLQFDLAAVEVVATQAVPCGLLVNELVSNCLKHAFPEGRSGVVRVSLRPEDGGPGFRLQVADDGVGLPVGFAVAKLPSLGLHLVSDLSQQLDGALAIGPGPGAQFVVTFIPKLPALPEYP